MEKTLVLIKPEAVQRKLVGEIISRFEKVGLSLERISMIQPTEEIVSQHYADDPDWIESVGNKTIDTYKKYNMDPFKDLGTDNPVEIGKLIRKWLISHLTSSPVIAIVLSGRHAVEITRKIVGNTVPLFADLGTIRGDYSLDSPDIANQEKRVLQNLVHASSSIAEAKREISLWFE